LRVKVKLYSILRDSTGLGEVEVEIPRGSRVSDLLTALMSIEGFRRAYEMIGGSLLLVDDSGSRLEGDSVVESSVVHVMPPPAGGSRIVEVGVLKGDGDFDVGALESRLTNTSPNGAIAFFIGRVKGVSGGERVLGLYYDYAEELLEATLRRIAEEEALKWGLSAIAIYHYVGWRKVGEKTIIVAVVGDSRKNVFPALEEVVERVKREAPIWKVEYRESGAYYILGDKTVKSAFLKTSIHQPSQPSS
jgi:molybdopterin synthase catalytic subunit